MFKKVLSIALSSAMAMSIAANAMAAISSPIYGIEGDSYGYNKDLGAVDLNEKNPLFTYGDTVYYPLLSTQGSEESNRVTEAQNNLTEANSLLEASKTALTEAETSLENRKTALTAANEKLSKAEAVLAAANEWKTASDSLSEDESAKQIAYNEALAAYNSELEAEISAEEAVRTATEFAEADRLDAETKTNEKNEAASLVETKKADVESKKAVVAEKQQALNEALRASNKYVTDSSDVKGIKVKSQWELNGNAVENVSLTKKKASAPFDMTNKYIYFISLELKDSFATSETDIIGTVSMKKTGEFDYEDKKLDVNLTVGYPEAEDNVITEKPMIFSSGNGFTGDSEEELRFSFDDDAFFTVDTLGQDKILLAADNEFDANIAVIYNAANLDFFNGNGASFNKLGTLTLPAPEGSHLYEVSKEGKLTKMNSPYDKDEEAFIIRTRTLGRYVISDVDLKVAPSVKPVSPNGVVNPQTGANI